ncbi:MAG: hypothetical protein K6E96_05035 [Bacteroidales bacterium]|nr:hypothetical protein [Bacteroidales bacterium]
MKKRYIKPTLEVFLYSAEEGYNMTVALEKDYVLIQGHDEDTRRASDEFTEYTDDGGQYTTGEWDW